MMKKDTRSLAVIILALVILALLFLLLKSQMQQSDKASLLSVLSYSNRTTPVCDTQSMVNKFQSAISLRPAGDPVRYQELGVKPIFGKDLPSPSNKRGRVILFWTSIFGLPGFGAGSGKKPFRNCLYENCEITHDRSRYKESDVIVFHMFSRPNQPLHPFPTDRRPDQVWIWLDLHPPCAVPKRFRHPLSYYNNKFNLTMTYRYDSDIPFPYANVRPYWPWERRPVEIGNIAKQKSRLVCHFTSHCRTTSRREDYIAELQKHIQVDVFGLCGNRTCSRQEAACRHRLQGKYKFIIAFENSICRDMVAEKLFKHGLSRDNIPIFRGGYNTHKYLPPKSYIDTRDFKSPKHLADYLKYLDKSDDEYNTYFEWRKVFKIVTNPRVNFEVSCHVCKYLHSNVQQHKHQVYHRIDEWWGVEKNCLSPYELDNKINLSKIF